MKTLALAVLVLSCSGGETPRRPCEAGDGGQTLGALAERLGLRFGDFQFSSHGDAGYQAARSEFDLITVPVYLRLMQPVQGPLDFSLVDDVADHAPPGALLYVPDLVSNDLLPDWLADGGFSPDARRDVMVQFITDVVQHFESQYPGRVFAYEPVLEPLSWRGHGGFWNAIGSDEDEYIRLAFRTARAAAPQGALYLDDFLVETAGTRSDEYYALVSSLQHDGVPIDGVGFEGHFMLSDAGSFPPPPSSDDLRATLDRFGALGLRTAITSADIAFKDDAGTADLLAQQADSFRELVRACLEAPSCGDFSTWGVDDADSWIPQAFPGWGSPLLFDSSYQPKPALAAVKAELTGDCQ